MHLHREQPDRSMFYNLVHAMNRMAHQNQDLSGETRCSPYSQWNCRVCKEKDACLLSVRT